MYYTSTDVKMMLESVNNQLRLNGNRTLYLVETKSRKVTLWKLTTETLTTGTPDREISSVVETNEMHEILASIQHLLQYLGL